MKCLICNSFYDENLISNHTGRDFCPACIAKTKEQQMEFQRSVIREEYMGIRGIFKGRG